MTSYPIVEIFHSVQGEGFHSGESSIFVRFGRCNLRCEWCDTNFDEFEEMSISQINQKIFEFNCLLGVSIYSSTLQTDLKTAKLKFAPLI